MGFNGLKWVFMGVYWVLLGYTGFTWPRIMAFTGVFSPKT